MKIWLVNHYAVPPRYYPLARPSMFAKHLINMGHDVTIIAASTVHNSNENLVKNNEKVKYLVDNGIPYVLVRCRDYQGNGVKRVINILEFSQKLPTVLKSLGHPDAIIATSFDPLSCHRGIKFAKRHGIKAVAEIADLWPETLIAYNGINPKNPLVKYLRKIEKDIYIQADAIVFTMEGAYSYIVERGWTEEIPQSKVYYINNGVDIKLFDYNKEHYKIKDSDLENKDLFKVVYAGAIRKVNNLDKLLNIAKHISISSIRFLIWGDGEELDRLKKRVEEEGIKNVVFKGKVAKEYIPYITSKADLNFAHNDSSELFRFGISFNKIFDYMAAGKPILCDFMAKYNPILTENAGIAEESGDERKVAKAIEELSHRNNEKLYSENARRAAEKYDFSVLTEKLLDVIESI